MIKAVFFDFYDTLVRFYPPREEQQARACREFGVEVEAGAIRRGYWFATDFMTRENGRFPLRKRLEGERRDFWAAYEMVLLRAAGVDIPLDLADKVISRLFEFERSLVLFDDVLPTLALLKERGLVLGLLSNLDRDLAKICAGLGLGSCLDFYIASFELDSEKPHPRIFLAALERAGAAPAEAIHVGDQYHADVVGARGVGIKPLLLDRDGFGSELDDCTRIRGLGEVAGHL